MSELQRSASFGTARAQPGRVVRLLSAIGARRDDLRLALQSMFGHKLRAALTLLGIVIGVFTVISMMALTQGLQNSMNQGMGSLRPRVGGDPEAQEPHARAGDQLA